MAFGESRRLVLVDLRLLGLLRHMLRWSVLRVVGGVVVLGRHGCVSVVSVVHWLVFLLHFGLFRLFVLGLLVLVVAVVTVVDGHGGSVFTCRAGSGVSWSMKKGKVVTAGNDINMSTRTMLIVSERLGVPAVMHGTVGAVVGAAGTVGGAVERGTARTVDRSTTVQLMAAGAVDRLAGAADMAVVHLRMAGAADVVAVGGVTLVASPSGGSSSGGGEENSRCEFHVQSF